MSRWLRVAELSQKEKLKIAGLDAGDVLWYLNTKRLTRADGDLFYKAVDKVLETNCGSWIASLILYNMVTREDSELYNQIINKILTDYPEYIYNLLIYNWLTREDGDLFYKAIDEIIKYSDDDFNPSWVCFLLLESKIITKDDGKLYNQVVNKMFERMDQNHLAAEILKRKIFTREDGDLFYKVLNKVEYPHYLIENGIITQEDLDKAK